MKIKFVFNDSFTRVASYVGDKAKIKELLKAQGLPHVTYISDTYGITGGLEKDILNGYEYVSLKDAKEQLILHDKFVELEKEDSRYANTGLAQKCSIIYNRLYPGQSKAKFHHVIIGKTLYDNDGKVIDVVKYSEHSTTLFFYKGGLSKLKGDLKNENN